MSQSKTPELLYAYTRQNALDDGVLIDATQAAKEAGFHYPLAFTATAWARCVVVPIDCPWQDESGRLWDVLWMLFNAIRRAPDDNPVRFSLQVCNHPSRSEEVHLKAHCGPGDDAQPVITIMLPHED